jgi:hypothetical protein
MSDFNTKEMEIFDESLDIALSVLLRNQELRSFDEATHFLAKEIAELMCRGERNVLLLSNFALDAYRLKPKVYLRLVQ